MTVARLWSRPILAIFAFAGVGLPTAIACGGGGGGLNAGEAALLTDFLILAVTPEGEEKDYKLVEVGNTKVDAGLIGVAINTLPLGFLGLGSDARAYDEAAEIAQCRAACSRNSQCRDFAYSRPTSSQPVGVCRLKKYAEGTSFGVMTPVRDAGERSERPVREIPAATSRTDGDKIVFDGEETAGSVRYDEARATPSTLKFLVPVSEVKVRIRAGEETEARSWAQLEAFDVTGKLIERTGKWISAGEFNFGHALAVSSGSTDRIATARVESRDAAPLRLDGVEYTRTLIVAVQPTLSLPAERVPPPPRLIVVSEHFPMPPRATPTAPPTLITPPPIELAAPTIETVPIFQAATPPPSPASPAEPVSPPAIAPAQRKRQLPLWLAASAVLFVFGGAGVYWRSHRKRTLNRLTTRLISNGLDRQTAAVESSSAPDIGLRFVVRSTAAVGAPGTHIELIPSGAYA